jgi:hypothetical protein
MHHSSQERPACLSYLKHHIYATSEKSRSNHRVGPDTGKRAWLLKAAQPPPFQGSLSLPPSLPPSLPLSRARSLKGWEGEASSKVHENHPHQVPTRHRPLHASRPRGPRRFERIGSPRAGPLRANRITTTGRAASSEPDHRGPGRFERTGSPQAGPLQLNRITTGRAASSEQDHHTGQEQAGRAPLLSKSSVCVISQLSYLCCLCQCRTSA